MLRQMQILWTSVKDMIMVRTILIWLLLFIVVVIPTIITITGITLVFMDEMEEEGKDDWSQ